MQRANAELVKLSTMETINADLAQRLKQQVQQLQGVAEALSKH